MGYDSRYVSEVCFGGMIRPRSSHSLFLKGPTGPWHSKVRFRYDSGYVSGMIRGMIRACNYFLKNRNNGAVSNTFKKKIQ